LGNEDWRPSYDDLRDHPPDHPQLRPRSELHISLMREQGYICCYCEKGINSVTSDVEHLKPRGRFPELELEYRNLLASCLGGRDEERDEAPREHQHCNPAKGDWFSESRMVSPLRLDCEEYFDFARDGQILPSQDPSKEVAAAETIKRLNLNSERLVRLRSNVLDGVFQQLTLDGIFEELRLEADDLQALMARSAAGNHEGVFQPFRTAIVSVATRILHALRTMHEAEPRS
jgi:uncharacterized protein (TIGR02646 family)